MYPRGAERPAQRQQGRRGQVRAGRIAADGEPRGVPVEALRMARSPAHGLNAVFQAGGERVLGRKAIIDAEHQIAGLREPLSKW